MGVFRTWASLDLSRQRVAEVRPFFCAGPSVGMLPCGCIGIRTHRFDGKRLASTRKVYHLHDSLSLQEGLRSVGAASDEPRFCNYDCWLLGCHLSIIIRLSQL